MSEYLDYHRSVSASGKTSVIEVRSRRSGDLLGTIKWFGRWRRYTFFPEPGTVFDAACLDDIIGTLERVAADEAAKA